VEKVEQADRERLRLVAIEIDHLGRAHERCAGGVDEQRGERARSSIAKPCRRQRSAP
jgi:hypothetical protein